MTRATWYRNGKPTSAEAVKQVCSNKEYHAATHLSQQGWRKLSAKGWETRDGDSRPGEDHNLNPEQASRLLQCIWRCICLKLQTYVRG